VKTSEAGPGNGRPWTVHIAENLILLVTSCSFRKVCCSIPSSTRKHQWVLETSRNTGIRWSSVDHLFRATRPEEKRHCCSVANMFLGSVASQLRWGDFRS